MTNICSVEDCDRPFLARGYCSRHYSAFRKYGNPLGRVMAERGAPMNWLMTHSTHSADECLHWPFKSGYKNGYGSVFFRNRLTGAHRVMCTLAHGEPLTPQHHAAHSCGNRGCVNPRHLRWATPSENEADKVLLGRSPRGTQNPSAKLTESEVREIVSMKGKEPQREIAARYGVRRELISQIHLGKVWGWLTHTAAE